MTYPEFKARYALTPDPQQEAAILRAEGPTLLLAVPGSALLYIYPDRTISSSP